MFAKIRLLCLMFPLVFAGCAFFAPDPHENFKTIMHSKIGKKWNELPSYQYPSEEYLFSSRILSNGNLEKRYKIFWGFDKKRMCIDIYEIDPKTDIIVGVDFEGKKKDCVINP